MVNAQTKRKKRQRDRVNAKRKKAEAQQTSSAPTTEKNTNPSVGVVSSTSSSPPPTKNHGSLKSNNSNKNATSMVADNGGNIAPTTPPTSTTCATIPTKPYVVGSSCSHKKFLTPQDGAEFTRLVEEKYRGFVHVAANQISPSNFHQRAKAALERLRDANYYQVRKSCRACGFDNYDDLWSAPPTGMQLTSFFFLFHSIYSSFQTLLFVRRYPQMLVRHCHGGWTTFVANLCQADIGR
jgi:hypothetical protein